MILVVAASGRLNDLLGFMRGPLAQVLIVLIVLHGFECHDRRTIRVGLAISSIVVMYASGFRVDGSVGWWLTAWALCFGIGLSKLSAPTVVERSTTTSAARLDFARWMPRVTAVGGGLLATAAVLIIVPVPSGPANLTLPTLIEGAGDVPLPGAVAGPDGEVRDGSDAPQLGDPSWAPAGQAGGYTGFAQEMDTSVRGALSDDVVMRVRAPQPDFWRGQTFARFDGRRWYADDDQGVRRDGPNIRIPSALGDIGIADDVAIERFVQTYYLEVDMPNLVFHANRPVQVIIDADAWTRDDGAIRASTVLPAGSIYTVVSARPKVDAGLLRPARAGRPPADRSRSSGVRSVPGVAGHDHPGDDHIGERAGPQPDVDVRRSSGRTSNGWRQNVSYDLDAPLPDDGEDAVHDFLFDSQLGFCEQIASSLTIMLRTQGVPARLVTGYLPGSRDRISGVFEVKSSDAHAWVEVWFPESGWQAFDPTASVPLSANSKIDSIGADLVSRCASTTSMPTGCRPPSCRCWRSSRWGRWQRFASSGYRRRRGRWGLLQDRFCAVATSRRRRCRLAESAPGDGVDGGR